MYNCYDFNSKVVLSLYEGELLGVVSKLFFDKKLKKLISLELLTDDGARLTLPTKNIYRVGKNAITVKNNQAVSIKIDDNELTSSPVGSKAYTMQGEFLGIIKDVVINDKYITDQIALENSYISISRLASCSKNTAIFLGENEKISLSKFTPQKAPSNFKTSEPLSVKTQPIVESKPNAESNIEEIRAPIQSTDFLLGRICTKDIYNFNNEILIKSHTIINKKNLKEIIRFGKLRELMLFSK